MRKQYKIASCLPTWNGPSRSELIIPIIDSLSSFPDGCGREVELCAASSLAVPAAVSSSYSLRRLRVEMFAQDLTSGVIPALRHSVIHAIDVISQFSNHLQKTRRRTSNRTECYVEVLFSFAWNSNLSPIVLSWPTVVLGRFTPLCSSFLSRFPPDPSAPAATVLLPSTPAVTN